MFEAGSGFAPGQLKAFIIALIVLVTFMWMFFTIKGTYASYAEGSLNGAKFMMDILKCIVVGLCVLAFMTIF